MKHDITIHHEWGWLYLIVIGVPSAVKNILTSLLILDGKKYYDRYPEKEADELGGIIPAYIGGGARYRDLSDKYKKLTIIERI